MSKPMLGWKIDLEDRTALLARFPPRYARPDADHVTFGREGEAPKMPEVSQATIVGRADDSEGVEWMVVAISDSTDRWDGSTYHITWSLGPGRSAVESNEVIAARGWEAIADGPQIGLTAARWD